jgi:hypothetical protein
LNRVNGNTLMVAAPTVQKTQQLIAPKQVKAKIEKPKFERGWQGVDNRQQVEQAMRKENAKNVPPPTFLPLGRKGESAGNAGNAGNVGNAGQAGPAPKRKRVEPSETNASNAGPAVTRPNADRVQPAQERRTRLGEQRQQQPERAQPNVTQRAGQDALTQVDRRQHPAERVQRPPQNRPPAQTRPAQPQENQDPNAERSAKKKKAKDEQPPPP